MKPHLLLTIMTFLFAGCVTVNLPTASGKKSKQVSFVEPQSPFKEWKPGSFDQVWLSQTTGNIIAYVSECGSAVDPSLKQLEADSLSALANLNVQSSELTNLNEREALATVAQGDVDGVATQVKLVVFKKNGCNYTLSYGGVKKNFTAELSQFESFVKDFKVP